MKKELLRQKGKQLFPLLVIAIVWFLIGWFARGYFPDPEVALVERTREALLRRGTERPSPRELSYAAVRGMLAETGDPYAALIRGEAARRFEADFAGETGVIGLFPEWGNGRYVASVVFPGDPAAAAGLRAGDEILSVDGVPFNADLSLPEAALLIRGPVGETADFVVRRDGETLQFAPVRERRTIVTGTLLPGDVAYVAQYTFTTNADEELHAVLQDLLAAEPRALIWDLRQNGGGSMAAAQAVLSHFIAEGPLFLVTQGKQEENFTATGEGLATEIPLLVLVGERTYSSAETAALVIQERERGLLIGGRTYGKGSVQTTIPVAADVLVQFTIGHWLSAAGTSVEGTGLEPDFSISDNPDTETDEVLEFAQNYLAETLPNP